MRCRSGDEPACADVVDAALGVKNLEELRLAIFDRHSSFCSEIKIDAQESKNERKQMRASLGGGVIEAAFEGKNNNSFAI